MSTTSIGSFFKGRIKNSAWKLLMSIAILSLFYSSCKKESTTPAENNDTTKVDTNTPIVIKVAAPKLIPAPVKTDTTGGVFQLTKTATIFIEGGSEETMNIGKYLASKLSVSTGFPIQTQAITGAPAKGNIYLALKDDATLGDEGYDLVVTTELVTLSAAKPEGLFRGIQTIRQLFPAKIEKSTLQTGPWGIPTVVIRDYPRFSYRGAMLDVSRHFFSVEDVERYMDLLAYYKINRFHLHLSDDQGWRIAIDSWPNLTITGASTQVGGGKGGFYTKEDYAKIIAYAQSRYMIVIPEIDMPGHTNAALSSYAELNCSGVAPKPYTGTAVGFSSFCTSEDITYKFIDDVVKEIAAITPGPFIHIGGDEASSTNETDYIYFVDKVQAIVEKYGKTMIGWEEVAQADLHSSSIAQHWNSNLASTAVSKGAKVIMSPASKAYMDMKYSSATKLGQNWAGIIEVKTAYGWDPASWKSGIKEQNILGVEAPLWTETLVKIADIEYMAFPRILGYAEMGWSPVGRSWDEYKVRLAAHGPRLEANGVNFFKTTSVTWE